jgi:hypothetical protein
MMTFFLWKGIGVSTVHFYVGGRECEDQCELIDMMDSSHERIV